MNNRLKILLLTMPVVLMAGAAKAHFINGAVPMHPQDAQGRYAYPEKIAVESDVETLKSDGNGVQHRLVTYSTGGRDQYYQVGTGKHAVIKWLFYFSQDELNKTRAARAEWRKKHYANP